MTIPAASVLAASGAIAPKTVSATADASAGAAAGAAGASPWDLQWPDPAKLMQAFGGLRSPANPPMPAGMAAPSPVAPSSGNPGAFLNPANTAALAAMIGGSQAPGVPTLGQLIGGR